MESSQAGGRAPGLSSDILVSLLKSSGGEKKAWRGEEAVLRSYVRGRTEGQKGYWGNILRMQPWDGDHLPTQRPDTPRSPPSTES